VLALAATALPAYAQVKPGDFITAENAHKVKGFLSPGDYPRALDGITIKAESTERIDRPPPDKDETYWGRNMFFVKVSDDEIGLSTRIAQLHEAMESGDFAAWYRLSSSSALAGQHVSFDEFKRIRGLEDTYGRMQKWGVRQATLKEICNCADYEYPAGPRVLRCAVLVDFVFNNSQKAEELESWDGVQGQWYWSHTDAQRDCPALH
jgi:hypothetical protein